MLLKEFFLIGPMCSWWNVVLILINYSINVLILLIYSVCYVYLLLRCYVMISPRYLNCFTVLISCSPTLILIASSGSIRIIYVFLKQQILSQFFLLCLVCKYLFFSFLNVVSQKSQFIIKSLAIEIYVVFRSSNLYVLGVTFVPFLHYIFQVSVEK